MPQGLPVLGGVGVDHVPCPRVHMMRLYSEHTEALNHQLQTTMGTKRL